MRSSQIASRAFAEALPGFLKSYGVTLEGSDNPSDLGRRAALWAAGELRARSASCVRCGRVGHPRTVTVPWAKADALGLPANGSDRQFSEGPHAALCHVCRKLVQEMV